MTSLDDLYVYYCRRCACKPNSKLRKDLREAYLAAGKERVLQRIDLSDNYVGPRGFQPLVLLLANLHSVEVLDARNNMLTHDSIDALADALQRHKGIREVHLSRNAFNDSSANLLLHMLRTNWRITDLSVEGNDLAPGSLARIEEQLAQNRLTVQKASAADDMLTQDQRAVLLEREIARYTPWISKIDVNVESHRSGGSLQYASWRDNLQHHLYVSHKASVTLTMTVADPLPTRLVGFALFRGESLLRVVDVTKDPSVVLAESSFTDTSVTVVIELAANPRTACKPYVVVPFSFAPGKPFACTLTASMPADIEGALIKLEPQDLRYDWYTNRIEGSWSETRSGGALAFSSWRESDMYRIRYTGATTAGNATLHFVLSKGNDDDDNDERAIGLYLLTPDSKGRRPIRAGNLYPGSVFATSDHHRVATVSYRVQVPCTAKGLDLFVMPCTLEPFQSGKFTLTVYSTCQIDLEHSPYSAGWATQRPSAGVWDAARSGGCRADNLTTWVHNPCYAFTVEGEPIDVHIMAVAHVTGRRDGTASSAATIKDRRGGAVAVDDVGILLVKADDQLTPIAQAPWFPASAGPAELWVNDLDVGSYYFLPVTRIAGHTGDYALTITSSRALHVDNEVPLAVRLRHKQLQRYDLENIARQESDAAAATKSAAPSAQRLASVPADMAVALELREAVIQAYHSNGTLFVDRDFPRGPSSVYKNAVERPYRGDHPAVAEWRRPSELFSAPTLARGQSQLGSVPQGYHTDWVHSALAVVASRPELLKQLVVTELPDYGLYQFAFFKQGAWRIITVDDFLPVDAAGALCFAAGVAPTDVLGALVEKAFAKLHRCYEALDAETTATTRDEASATSDSISESGDVGYSLTSRALLDFTGGMPLERRLYDTEGKAWAMKGFWSHLTTCRSQSRVIALRLSPHTPRAMEKKEHGIYLDRLYPVLDAREVEGLKLVKLRNFWGWGLQDSGARKEWGGKWRAGSPNWTPEIVKAVVFDAEDKSSFWMSAEEVIFYFGVVHTLELNKKSCWVAGSFAAGARGGDLLTGTWQNNPQYALRLGEGSVGDEGPTTVIIGVHQPDALQLLTRTEEARVEYLAAIGATLVRSDNDQRKLQAITPQEVPFNGPNPRHARDAYYAVTFDPRCRYLLMPFNATPALTAAYSLSVWSDRAVALSLVSSDRNVAIEGEWSKGSAGGPPSYGTWRDNPQYVLFAAEATTVTIVLRQRNELNSTTDHIGFTVLRAHTSRRIMKPSDCTIVADVAHQNTHAVQCNVRLESTVDRLGMPYVIVPSLSVPNAETGFTLEVISNARVTVRPLDKELDYCRRTITGQLDFAQGNAGGSMAFSSWRCNPQYAVTFPVTKSGTLVVSLTKRVPSDTQPVGVVALRADEWDHGRRRKVVINPKTDVLAESPLSTGTFTEFTLNFEQARQPIIIMPFAEQPFSSLEYDLTLYCTADIDVTPVGDWVTQDVAGSWELGLTAGGSREKHKSWINNPAFALSVTRPTRVILVALQYPRGPEKPVVRRVGPNRVLMPPPIVNDKTKVCFGFDFCRRDAGAVQFEVTHSTKHTFDGEISMCLTLEACQTEPYFVVPHTYDAEEEADFRVVAYADQPIQFYPFQKERKTF